MAAVTCKTASLGMCSYRDLFILGSTRTHLFPPELNSWLEDRIVWEFPFGILGNIFGGWFTQRKLKRLFEYRHRITDEAMRGNK